MVLSGSQIRGYLFDNTAAPVSGQINISTSNSGSKFFPSVTALSDGEFGVVWSWNGYSGYEIDYRRFDASGQPTTTDVRIDNPAIPSSNLATLAPTETVPRGRICCKDG